MMFHLLSHQPVYHYAIAYFWIINATRLIVLWFVIVNMTSSKDSVVSVTLVGMVTISIPALVLFVDLEVFCPLFDLISVPCDY